MRLEELTASLAVIRRVHHRGPNQSLSALSHGRIVPTGDLNVLSPRLLSLHGLVSHGLISFHAS